MSSFLPEAADDSLDLDVSLSGRDLSIARRQRSKAILDVYGSRLAAEVRSEKAKAQMRGATEVAETGFELEVDFLNHVRARADGDAVANELGRMKLLILNRFNNNKLKQYGQLP